MTDFSIASTSVDNPESLRYLVNWAVKNEFNGVEFNAPEMFLGDQKSSDIEWAAEIARDHGLRYTHHFPPSAHPGSHSTEVRGRDLQTMFRELRAASYLGVETMVLHPGRLDVFGVEPGEESTEQRHEAIGYFIEWTQTAAIEAEKLGVVIGVENMHYNPGWVIRSHQELAEVVDKVASTAVGITFDSGHAWGSGGVEAGIEILGDRIKHLQVHDARGPEGAGNVRDQHLEIGTGVLNWQSVGDLAMKNDFAVVIETSGRDPNRESIALRSRDYLTKIWET